MNWLCKMFNPNKPIPSLDDYIKWVRQQVGKISKYETALAVVKAELTAMGIIPMFTTDPDTRVFYTDETSLKKMLPFLTFSAEYYVANLDIDCDDYAMWAAGFARLIFQRNGIYQAWGYMDLGYHAFNIAKVSSGKYLLFESNAGFEWAGELFQIGEHNYKPDKFK